jgi:hypothetical protein
MNFLLVSSEHSFPSSLSRFNCDPTKGELDLIFAGAVSPKETYKLLTEKWGMGKHLASGLIGSRGGNIYKIYKSMEKLVRKKKMFACIEPIESERARKWYDNMTKLDQDVAKPVLKALANKGFVKINGDQRRVAEILSESNIAGVVTPSSVKCDRSEEFEKDREWDIALVPSSQAMRLAIFRAFKFNM